MRPQSMRNARLKLEEQQPVERPQTGGLFSGINPPNFVPINASELDVMSPNVLQMIAKKLTTLSSNMVEIQTVVEQISKVQATTLKLEQQIDSLFYTYMDSKINPDMLKVDQKISNLMDQLEHPKQTTYSTIDMAEKIAEIEQQVYSDSMGMLTDDVTQIKKMLVSIQQKLEK
ncbi:Conserved_hypothetical protein [Hexamita inflata]|uniref:Uncharacterized protein n=1 Tax=Hexamita inflata TaxID=28002 RepID=A0AA86PVF7_9EUKA|nr:Conserved hypothetical protein [Hexamita inflata]CAI9974952.1 Conserved hypothetical protein [Hexamita inflata]